MADMIYAGFWRRLLAHFIDAMILSASMFILMVPLGILVGGVLVGQDLIKAAEKRKAMQHPTQHESQWHTTQRIVPLANEMLVAQTHPAQGIAEAAPKAEAPLAVDDTEITTATDTKATKPPEKISDAAAALINLVAWCFALIAGLLYHPLFIGSKWMATPGKKAMGCVVVSPAGERITRMHALGRHLACALSWLPFPPFCIGFFLAGWTKQSTALHDMIASTRVVRVLNEAPVIATRG